MAWLASSTCCSAVGMAMSTTTGLTGPVLLLGVAYPAVAAVLAPENDHITAPAAAVEHERHAEVCLGADRPALLKPLHLFQRPGVVAVGITRPGGLR